MFFLLRFDLYFNSFYPISIYYVSVGTHKQLNDQLCYSHVSSTELGSNSTIWVKVRVGTSVIFYIPPHALDTPVILNPSTMIKYSFIYLMTHSAHFSSLQDFFITALF